MTRNDLIKKIHVIKRDLGMIDEDYRMVLYNISGKTSCADIGIEELNLIAIALGKMMDNTGTGSPIKKNPDQHRFIARLMDILGWDWSRTAEYCQQITGKRTTKACTPVELSKIIRGMIATIDHHLEHGKIEMSHTEKFNYLQHTKHVRQSHVPPQREDAGESHRQQPSTVEDSTRRKVTQ
jgi:phage gp16-like protein